jgi:putative ABC transport system permease protein
MRSVAAFLKTLFRGRRLERELDDELAAYLEQRIAQRVAAGVDAAEARRQVLADEGGIELVKEQTREARTGVGAAMLIRDVAYGWRMMRRAPGVAAVACLTLAIGIGASIAVVTVMQSVVWRPLPYPNADRLVVVEVDARGVRDAGASAPEVIDLRTRVRTLERVASINAVAAHVVTDEAVDGLAAANVSDDLLPVLGGTPALGRTLEARRDTDESAARGVVISDALWRRRFGADPGAIGRSVVINNQPREIVGVLPPGFTVLLPPSIGALEQTDVWFSTAITDEGRQYRGLGVVARLTAQSTVEEAQREVDLLAARLAVEHPAIYENAGVQFRVRNLREAVTAPVRPGLTALGGAVAFVLLLSCVNVANLLLARGVQRGRELSVRRALGATRARLVRQLITESLVLAIVGSALGLVLGHWAVDAVDWLRPTHLPRQAGIGMDAAVAAIAIGITFAAALFFGGLPAFRLTAGPAQVPGAGRGDTATPRARRTQRTLVVAQIALSIVPVLAAGLMLRSFVNLTQTRLGFEPQAVLTAQMPISLREYRETEARWQLHQRAFDRLRALPGVDAVSAVSPLPFGPLQFTRRYGRAGAGPPASVAALQSAFPGYLSVVGTQLVAGRDFTDDDVRQRKEVALIDARIARGLWPDGAVGQHLALASETRTRELEIIGVTEPVRSTAVRDDTRPLIILPFHLLPVEMALVIKSAVPAEAMAPAIRREIAALGTGRAVDVQPLDQFVRGSIAETRFTSLVLTAFGGMAMLLAAVGLYGTLAYLTSQRTREFGVRLALGATRRQIVALVAREGLLLAMLGGAIGLAGAMVVAQTLRAQLYGVGALDPRTIGAVIALTAALAVAACTRPAWTAARTDPVRVIGVE